VAGIALRENDLAAPVPRDGMPRPIGFQVLLDIETQACASG